MGKWQKELIKFGLVGVINTLIDFGVFNVLIYISGVRSGWVLGVLNMIAIALAGINSYCLNRRWTFAFQSDKHGRQLVCFILASLFSMLLNSLTVIVVAETLRLWLNSPYVVLNIGKLVGAVLSATSNFLLYRYWVFAEKRIATQRKGADTNKVTITPRRGETCTAKRTASTRVPEDEFWMPGFVSVIIPAYNEINRLPMRLRNLAKSLPAYFPVEIIVVDDGSKDGTGVMAQKIAREYPWVHCISYPVNRGKGEAVRKGMLAAHGEYLIFTDADETFSVQHIAEIANQLRKGVPVAVGMRVFGTGQRTGGESRLRRALGKCFNRLVQAIALPGMEDTQCGLKGFSREAARQIFTRQRLRGFAFDVEILTLARRLNYLITQVPVQAKDCHGSRVRLLSPVAMCLELVRYKVALFFNLYRLPGGGNRLGEAGLALGLFALALAARIPWLWAVPRFIDELKEVYLSYLIYLGKSWPLHNAAHDIGALHNYILAGLFTLFGPGPYLPRLYVACTSAATVPLMYFLGKRLFGRTTGLIAAGLLLTNGMHILVSHMAWANSTTTFFFALALLTTLVAEEKKSGKWLVGAGFFWALTLQTHASVGIYLVVCGLYILGRRFRAETRIANKWYYLSIAAFLLGYANMIYYNIISRGGSFLWLGRKSYTLNSEPGLASFLQNLRDMYIELIRTISSTYTRYEHWQTYFRQPVFLLGVVLLGLGMYLAWRKGVRLPNWLICAGFMVIPWVNSRYYFYLATRYIMPIVFCATLLGAYASTICLAQVWRQVERQVKRQMQRHMADRMQSLMVDQAQSLVMGQVQSRMVDQAQSLVVGQTQSKMEGQKQSPWVGKVQRELRKCLHNPSGEDLQGITLGQWWKNISQGIWATALILLCIFQLVPLYQYYHKLSNTNQSNDMSLAAMTTVLHSSVGRQAVILLDENLQIENDPLPYLLELNRKTYEKLSTDLIENWLAGSKELGILAPYLRQRMLAVVTSDTYTKLVSSIKVRKISDLTTRLTLNAPASQAMRQIYIVELYTGEDGPVFLPETPMRQVDIGRTPMSGIGVEWPNCQVE